jgi:hypothetical protein
MARKHSDFVLLTKVYHGAMITSAETAVGVAKAILQGHYGEAEVARQQPLRAKDDGASWLVEGSYRDPGLEPEGGGSWYARIMKDDGRIVSLGHRIHALEFPTGSGSLQGGDPPARQD